MSGVLKLLANVGADTGVDVLGEFKFWSGGPGDFVVTFNNGTGDFGGGVVELQLTPDDGANIICMTELDLVGVVRFTLNHGFKIRAILVDTTAPSSGITAEIF